MSVDKAAQYMRRSRRTVFRLVENEKLRSALVGKRGRVLHKKWCDDYLESVGVGGTTAARAKARSARATAAADRSGR